MLKILNFLLEFFLQAVFPFVEYQTASCKNASNIVEENLSKRQCLSKGFEYNAFDISGHAFLMTYCIFVLLEESIALKYILALNHELCANVEEFAKVNRAYFSFNVHQFKSYFCYVYPLICFSLVAIACLSIIWDLMLIITSLYYHTVLEKIIGMGLAIITWNVLYPFIFRKYKIL